MFRILRMRGAAMLLLVTVVFVVMKIFHHKIG